MIKRIILSLVVVMVYSGLIAQSSDHINTFKQNLLQNSKTEIFKTSDLTDLRITDEYTELKTGITHIYLQQYVNNTPIHNAVGAIHIKNGEIFMSNHLFIDNLKSKVTSSAATISAVDAIYSVATDKNIENVTVPLQGSRNNQNELEFKGVSYTNSPVKVKQVYTRTEDNQVRLTYDVFTDMKDNDDIWSTRVDAENGKVLDQFNHTIYCNFDHGDIIPFGNYGYHSTHESETREAIGNYRVYPLPAESPLDGAHDLIIEPFILAASPLGWHDTDGMDGADDLITKGNNVHAYLDKNNDNASDGSEPSGGESLIFDFPHDLDGAPGTSDAAAQVNLFYMNNMMHDLTYALGFDEAAGNFQLNNYNNGGQRNDAVDAEASDGSGEDNANFATGADGTFGIMQMYLWNNPVPLLTIQEPQDISGLINKYGEAEFGTPVSVLTEPLTAKIVVVDDGSANSNLGCDPLINQNEMTGNIALVQRGGCNFVDKTKAAQDAGAIAVLICNIAGAGPNGSGDGNQTSGMTAPAGSPSVTIPTLMIRKSLCDKILISIFNDQNVTITFEEKERVGPLKFDAAFDNGVIAHEYGHGISNRLVSGPNNVGCLANDEQMGEGWSDFWTIAFTTKNDDDGIKPKAIGNYVDGRPLTGRGIRSYPYSTDMNVNPLTYNDIKGTTAPHPVGTVWNSMLFDIYWAFIDLYGFNEDWTIESSGNFKAATLVVEAMKLTACNPGFIDGRDAILAADLALYDGTHECMIWEKFARRGLGFYADQGSTANRNDGVEDYETLPTCIQTLKIKEETTSVINPDEKLDVKLTLNNHIQGQQTGVVVTSIIPAGLSYVEGSGSITPTIDNNEITFNIETLDFSQEFAITYQLQPDGSSNSISVLYDGLEDGIDDSIWEVQYLSGFDTFFDEDNDNPHTGEKSWYIDDFIPDTDQAIKLGPIDVSGEKPTLKFWHKFITEDAIDGGFVEVSTDGGNIWEAITKDQFLRNGYNSTIAYGTFAIPSLDGFTGDSQGYIDSYVDLSDFHGQSIYLRFRFGTNEEFNADQVGSGWYIDDVEFINLVTYEISSCISSEQSDDVCSEEELTILNTDFHIGTNELIEGIESFNISPNPAKQNTIVNITSIVTAPSTLAIYNMSGVKVLEKDILIVNGDNQFDLNLENIISGQYTVIVNNQNGQLNSKLTIVK